jgi:hypothetical protein
MYLCSFLPHDSVMPVASFCLSRVRSTKVPEDWTELDLAALDLLPVYIDALCNWGRYVLRGQNHSTRFYFKESLSYFRGDDLLEMISRNIERGTSPNSVSERRR